METHSKGDILAGSVAGGEKVHGVRPDMSTLCGTTGDVEGADPQTFHDATHADILFKDSPGDNCARCEAALKKLED
ncbi:hypothetical protein [Rhodococcoides fascians]|uniref:hypothetical protein n=1 Tax=Rhodococcoides fascians TaxID=1828 RepID=UPI00050C8990|nr:hypothetical protein [Rhodococcus fascians]